MFEIPQKVSFFTTLLSPKSIVIDNDGRTYSLRKSHCYKIRHFSVIFKLCASDQFTRKRREKVCKGKRREEVEINLKRRQKHVLWKKEKKR